MDDTIQLQDIAMLCPYIYGEAVYEARSVLSGFYGIPYDYSNNCELVPENKKEKRIENLDSDYSHLSYKLYPNPNNGNMQLDYLLDVNQSGKLLIYDLLGHQVDSYFLEQGNNTLQINENNLYSGIYFYRIFVNEKLETIDKVVIIK